MTSDRSMSLILCGDPKQDQQENSLLRFIMIHFGMQLINMTSTKLQNKHRERFNFKVDDRSKVVGGAQKLKPLMDM